jgi:hypothetical protein
MLNEAIEIQENAFNQATAQGNTQGAEQAEFERRQLSSNYWPIQILRIILENSHVSIAMLRNS